MGWAALYQPKIIKAKKERIEFLITNYSVDFNKDYFWLNNLDALKVINHVRKYGKLVK